MKEVFELSLEGRTQRDESMLKSERIKAGNREVRGMLQGAVCLKPRFK